MWSLITPTWRFVHAPELMSSHSLAGGLVTGQKWGTECRRDEASSGVLGRPELFGRFCYLESMSEDEPSDSASLPEEDQGLSQSGLPYPPPPSPGRKCRSIFAGRSWRDVFEKTKRELGQCTPEGGPFYWFHDIVDTDEEPPHPEDRYRRPNGKKCRRCGMFFYVTKPGLHNRGDTDSSDGD